MDIMNEEGMVIMVSGYTDLSSAQQEFTTLNDAVKKGRLNLREALLVSKDDDGTASVTDARNRHGRSGAGFGAGLGVLVGLAAPPLAASVAVGAVAGMLVAKFADHSLKSGLRHEVAQALQAGTAVVIVLLRDTDRQRAERFLTGAATTSVVPFAESTFASIEAEVVKATATEECGPTQASGTGPRPR